MYLKPIIKKSTIILLWKSLLLFFFIYDIALQGVSTKFSSRKVAFVIVTFIFLYQCHGKISGTKRIIELYVIEIAVCVVSFLHVFMRAFLNELNQSNFAEYPFVVYFILFGLLAPICFTCIFQSIEEFFKALILATILQSIFVIIEFWCWPMRIWLSKHIYTTTNILYTDPQRATGLGASGAQLSVWLFFGIFASGYFLITRKGQIKYWGSIFLIFIAQFLSGRTGLYLGIIHVFIILFFYDGKKQKIMSGNVVAIGGAVIILGMALMGGVGKLSSLSELINRTTNITRIIGQGSFMDQFTARGIPSLNLNTVLGYGVIGGITNDGSIWHHDSGYLKRYVADGIIMAILEYVFFLILLLGIWKKIENSLLRKYTFGLIWIVFIIEIKEPFMYYYSSSALTLCILMLSGKRERGKRYINENNQCYCSSI